MTGYGRCEEICNNRKILTEIKSVNHRYSDYSIKIPKNYGFLEEILREESAKHIFRGKVDIYVSVEDYRSEYKAVIPDMKLAEGYINALNKLRDDLSLKDDISVSLIAGFSDIFKTVKEIENPDEICGAVMPVFLKAVDEFIKSREREGKKMYADLVSRIKHMQGLVEEIEKKSPQTKLAYEERLRDKIEELLGDKSVDETRLLTEVAIFADKIAVDEEVVRLKSHFDEFCRIIDSGEPAGRKLDFLVQEINREINTIGSKACDIDISKLVIDLKAEAEKVREQIQNIE